jgi:hypothetical protein
VSRAHSRIDHFTEAKDVGADTRQNSEQTGVACTSEPTESDDLSRKELLRAKTAVDPDPPPLLECLGAAAVDNDAGGVGTVFTADVSEPSRRVVAVANRLFRIVGGAHHGYIDWHPGGRKVVPGAHDCRPPRAHLSLQPHEAPCVELRKGKHRREHRIGALDIAPHATAPPDPTTQAAASRGIIGRRRGGRNPATGNIPQLPPTPTPVKAVAAVLGGTPECADRRRCCSNICRHEPEADIANQHTIRPNMQPADPAQRGQLLGLEPPRGLPQVEDLTTGRFVAAQDHVTLHVDVQ